MARFPNRRSFAQARAELPGVQWNRLLGKAGLACLIGGAFLWLLANRLSDVQLQDARLHLFSVAPSQWLAATFATFASFWAVGHYDGVIHRYLATGAHPSDARRAGATAIAVSQSLGLGVITGAIVRWRMLPDQSLWQATKITTLVAAFFLGGWVVVTATVLVALPHAPFKVLAGSALTISIALALLGAVMPSNRPSTWPNLFITSRLLALAALDTLTAAAALWLLFPPEYALPFETLLPAFLLAYGAGLVSGTPGGVGAFEITLIALLPSVPEAPLLAAILAWRGVYFALPAVIGAGFAIRGPARRRRSRKLPPRPTLTRHAVRAEASLLVQGRLGLTAAGENQVWLSGRTAHCLIGMLDPISDDPHISGCDRKTAIAALIDAAKAESRLPVLYKCTARTAIAARQLGLILRPIAREAWLDPRLFTLATPARAGLRRKLRRAVTAGITTSHAHQNWADMAGINTEWAKNHGGERGFSMGQFDHGYLQGQRVYTAIAGGKPVAFISFHMTKHEWALDLMRHTKTMPDGTMQALVVAAITDCARQNIARLSLSAVPLASLATMPVTWFAKLVHRILGGNQTGLAQFKSSFAPNWQTLYLSAPHRPGLVIAGAEIARAVHLPTRSLFAVHQDHAEYEIASAV